MEFRSKPMGWSHSPSTTTNSQSATRKTPAQSAVPKPHQGRATRRPLSRLLFIHAQTTILDSSMPLVIQQEGMLLILLSTWVISYMSMLKALMVGVGPLEGFQNRTRSAVLFMIIAKDMLLTVLILIQLRTSSLLHGFRFGMTMRLQITRTVRSLLA